MTRIDYDTEQFQDYARGRALTEQQLRSWGSAFAAVLPERRPLAGLDVGSGTGRFTPTLARTFGPVTGIEPSVRMGEIAQAQSQHPVFGTWLAPPRTCRCRPAAPTTLSCSCPGTTSRTSRRRPGSWPGCSDPAGGCYCARISATTIPSRGGWSTSPAALRQTPRCFSRCTRSSRCSRRPAGALPASARLPRRPPAPAVTRSNGCACAPFRSSGPACGTTRYGISCRRLEQAVAADPGARSACVF